MVGIWRSLSEACLTEPKKEMHLNSKMDQNDTKSQSSLMLPMWFANTLHIPATFRLNGILASGELNAKFATVIALYCHCNLILQFFCQLFSFFSAARYGHIVHCNVCPPKVLALQNLKDVWADKSKFKTKTMPTMPVRYDNISVKTMSFCPGWRQKQISVKTLDSKNVLYVHAQHGNI